MQFPGGLETEFFAIFAPDADASRAKRKMKERKTHSNLLRYFLGRPSSRYRAPVSAFRLSAFFLDALRAMVLVSFWGAGAGAYSGSLEARVFDFAKNTQKRNVSAFFANSFFEFRRNQGITRKKSASIERGRIRIFSGKTSKRLI